jgi:hypothetical protein
MVIEEPDKSNIVIERRLGSGTGDVLLKTADGRWWQKYYGGHVATGNEVKNLKDT